MMRRWIWVGPAAVVWVALTGSATQLPNWAGPPAPDTTITIRAIGSTLEFVPPKVSVKNGLRVRIRFINEGTLPHNFVVPRDPNDIEALGVAAYQADQTGYVPLDKREKMLGYTTLASPGDTVETTFVVPPPGVYSYVCLFPGHYNTMLGTLRSLH